MTYHYIHSLLFLSGISYACSYYSKAEHNIYILHSMFVITYASSCHVIFATYNKNCDAISLASNVMCGTNNIRKNNTYRDMSKVIMCM